MCGTLPDMNDEQLDRAELQAEVISIGTELLLGEIVDTNAAWLAAQLPALGIPLYRIQQVGDNRARLTATLAAAWERTNLLLLTGGLGPTEDDVTREAIADLVGEPMQVAPDLETELRGFYARRNRVMPPSNVKQATLIASATTLANPIGTAPGWWVSHEGRYLATMPGVPVEMRRMWRDQVAPRLLELPRGEAIVSRTLKILGIGESAVEEQLGTLVRGTNPTVATYAKSDGVHVRLAARGADRAAAFAHITAVEAQIRRIFGASIFGVDGEDLPTSVAALVAARGRTLGVVESGLGGALCSALGSIAHGGLVLPAQVGEGDPAAAALALARRGAADFGAAIALGAVLIPGSGDVVDVGATVVTASRQEVRVERHRTERGDAPRRGMLLALGLLRDVLLQEGA